MGKTEGHPKAAMAGTVPKKAAIATSRANPVKRLIIVPEKKCLALSPIVRVEVLNGHDS